MKKEYSNPKIRIRKIEPSIMAGWSFEAKESVTTDFDDAPSEDSNTSNWDND